MKIIDLSKPIQYNQNDPWFMKIKVKHTSHRKSKLLIRILGLPAKLLPKGFQGWAIETIKMGTHSSTHIDAHSIIPRFVMVSHQKLSIKFLWNGAIAMVLL
jgi:kynurenine formamidase